ncbi:MAG: peptide MFS transporter [Lishizhenia sp.]
MGHPAGLFILFFTEMWERFSYYGMRALLVLFLVSSTGLGGWEWTNAEALSLYATYTGLVYVTPIFGGLLADRSLGYRRAVVLGALLMTLGHASMAFETELTFYLGLGLLIIGNGFFKPNISTIVGGLYKSNQEKKDAGYTIFYMGINAGAFLGILLCGYVGEKVGWSYGFGLAGIFMLLGMFQFYFSQKIFEGIGLKPKKKTGSVKEVYEEIQADNDGKNFVVGFDEAKVTSDIDKELPNLSEGEKKGLFAEIKERFKKRIVSDRLVVIGVLAFFTIFFWMAFEQAGGSMTIFAADFTDRILEGGSATAFTVINTIITIVPLAIITWVLLLLFKATFKRYALSNLFLGSSFVIIWAIVIWMLNKEFNMKAYEVSFTIESSEEINDTIQINSTMNSENLMSYLQENNEKYSKLESLSAVPYKDNKVIVSGAYNFQKTDTTTIRQDVVLADGAKLFMVDIKGDGNYRYITEEKAAEIETNIEASVIREKDKEIEVAASWFGVLNSLFIILFAPIFSKIWESKYNPSAPIKFALGLILLGAGFGILAFGAMGIEQSAFGVSMIWLILAYLMHTLGELTLSPVGLSYVSKLAPAKLISFMFGIWFTATAVANYLAGKLGSLIDSISEEHGLSSFFLIFTLVPIVAGLILIAMNKWLLKKMHGIR